MEEMKKKNLKKRLVFGIVMMLITGIFCTISITVSAQTPPIADAGGPYEANECVAILFDASKSTDPDGDSLWYRWYINGNWTEYSQNPYTEYVWLDDYTGMVIVEVTDEEFNVTDTASVIINNVPPSISSVNGPTSLIEVGDEAEFLIEFIDEDERSSLVSLDTFNVSIEWGDDTSYKLNDLDAGIRNITVSHIFSEAGEYEIVIKITDDDGGLAVAVWDIAVSKVYAGPDGIIEEGGTFLSSGFFIDPIFEIHTATAIYGDGSGTQPLTLIDNNFTLNHTYADDGIYIIETEVMSGFNEIGSDSATVTVLNVAPRITSLIGPKDPVQIGTSIRLLGNFSDPGLLDDHIAVFDWGDNSSTKYELDGGIRNVTGFHKYNTSGVFTIILSIFDDDGANDSMEFRYVVVYDPDGGFVTGGGWINSPEGAYTSDSNLTGKAHFGFVSKYKKGQQKPSGNTEFQFQVADLNFHSDSYDWLVIAGHKAMFKGNGTIKGSGNFGFIITAIDEKLTSSTDVDLFRIKIWNKDNNNEVIYDNQLDDPENNDPTTEIAGGQIVIHKG